MNLRNLLLSAETKEFLQKLAEYIKKDKELLELQKFRFKIFLEKELPHLKREKHDIDRTTTNPKSRQYEYQIALFDFYTEEFFPTFIMPKKKIHNNYQEIIYTYEDMLYSTRRKFDSTRNPMMALHARHGWHADEIPMEFEGEFFGYRRSSTAGDVIRYYLKTTRSQGYRTLTYINEYRRDEKRWRVLGVGVYESSCLYLFGHAFDPVSQESKGFRLLTLKKLGETKLLTGIVISMDNQEPIGASTILIPKCCHNFNNQQKKLKNKPDKFIDYMIKTRGYAEKEKYIQEIKYNTENLFDPHGDDGVFYYISNFTLSVLKGEPPSDDALIELEVLFRSFIQLNTGSQDSVKFRISEILKKGYDDFQSRGG